MKLLSNTLVITKAEEYNNAVISLLFNDKRAIEINCSSVEDNSILNNIYVGKVKNIVKNIGAAFIEIADNIICYYKIDENPNPIYTKRQSENRLCIGDEILVQVIKEPQKTKQHVVSSNLSFITKNLILTSGNKRIGISNKLDIDTRNRLKDIGSKMDNSEFGIIFRTNAKNIDDEELIKQINSLTEEFQEIIRLAKYRTCFSLCYKGQEGYISKICGMYDGVLDKIITDDKEIYDNIIEYVKSDRPEYLDIVEFYDDNMISLEKLYGVKSEITSALSQRVWLKSGAYLVIQPTEALTVIDVNTGKFIGNKKQQETFLKINLEAAKEIAIQLILRNISGICIVDFIDMELEESKIILLNEFKKYLSEDPVNTTLVDMTKLNLVEITRKRIKKPLYEQINQI